ncbi:hypothetical protein VKT23_019556 [Stygiomarasmius scandens]|uniref:Uncharacterized protein n=1 Tax=Marasmiellus scandens TaxID=2682957 RepID=A0ABR1ILA8_9AGAR
MMSFLKQYNLDWSFPRVKEIADEIEYEAFDPNVIGRVDITNTFIGAELNTEYLFGMFSVFGQSKNTSLIGVPLNQTVVQLIAQGNTISTSIIVTFNWTVTLIPLQFNTMFMFNDEGKVIQYDSQLLRSTRILPTLLPLLAPRLAEEFGLPPNTDPLQLVALRAANDICFAHEHYCTGALKQYNSTRECMDFLLHQVPFGDINLAGQNTAQKVSVDTCIMRWF